MGANETLAGYGSLDGYERPSDRFVNEQNLSNHRMHASRQSARWPLLACAILVMETGCISADESAVDVAATSNPSGVVDVVQLRREKLTESSGLAFSSVRRNHVWTHNDSGSKARLYAFDTNGKCTAERKLKSVEANDWEDLCGYVDDGVPRLLVADCGDNARTRDTIKLYLMNEPDPQESDTIRDVEEIEVRYPDGARDCEAVAVDVSRRLIVLITKSFLPSCGVYVLPLPPLKQTLDERTVTARRIGSLPLPMVTAMDIDPVSGDIWVVSYFQAFQFKAGGGDRDLAWQLKQLPIAHELPRWRQIEAVAIDANQDVWVTSEGSPAPLGRLPQRRQNVSHSDANQK